MVDARIRDRVEALGEDPARWKHRAACRRHPNPDWWHGGDSGDLADLRAIEICNRCPVRIECVDFATRHDQYGYWGSTRHQRRHGVFITPAGQST